MFSEVPSKARVTFIPSTKTGNYTMPLCQALSRCWENSLEKSSQEHLYLQEAYVIL